MRTELQADIWHGTGAVGKRGDRNRHVASAGDRPPKKGAQWGLRAP